MEVVEGDVEGGAALQVVDEAGEGLRGLGGVGLREVDEVGAVREDVGGGVGGCGLGEGEEGGFGFGGEGGGRSIFVGI